MHLLYNIAVSLSYGIFIGFLLGIFKIKKRKHPDTSLSSETKLQYYLAGFLKYITFFMLVEGLVWCLYFLLLGILQPNQADYANNMAELIVSLLTVISIIFAFVEFLRRDKH